jgi:Protein kinase domain
MQETHRDDTGQGTEKLESVGDRLTPLWREPPRVCPMGAERYELGVELGRGGSGQVHEAVDRQFERVVAVKRLAGTGERAWRNFIEEALVTGSLEHPGIPSVYERGVGEDGVPFYAMRRIRGRTLAEALRTAGTLEERLALLPVVVRVAQTLAFAHDRGVVHRDVKPQNIIVGEHGETTLIDWGIAKVLPADASTPRAEDATVAGTVLGTPAYMSPEQAEGRVEQIDRRTDVFALGALLYHLLSGQSPYGGAGAVEIVANAAGAKRRPVREVAPRAPRVLTDICEKAMARLPEARFASATEMVRALEQFERDALLSFPRTLRWLTMGALALTAIPIVTISIGAFRTVFAHTNGPPTAAMNVYVYFAALSLGLAAIEWRTRGRFALFPVGVTLAVSAVLCSFATAFGALLSQLKDPAPGVLASTAEYHAWALDVLRRTTLGLRMAALVSTVVLIVWSLVRRRTLLEGR